jgi:hypothetical protein
MRNGLGTLLAAIGILVLLLAYTGATGATLTHNDTAITLEGEITDNDARNLDGLMERTGIRTVYLNSPGGSSMEGYRLGYTLMRREALAIVPEGSSCMSACAIAFVGAPSKVLAGILGFHVAWSPDNPASFSEGMKSGQFIGAVNASFFFNAGYTAQLPTIISQLTDHETFLILTADDLRAFRMVDNNYTDFIELPDHWLYERIADPLRMYLLTKGY